MKKILTLNLLLILFLLGSCKKLVEVGLPNDKIVTKAVFTSDDIAISALTSIYARMNTENTLPYNISLLTGMYSDELKSFSAVTSLVSVYTNSLNQINEMVPSIWKIGYNHIYNANAVYEGCQESTTLSLAVKKQLMAEARFIRAFWHFYLVNLYGNIPLITSTDYTQNATAFNSTKEKIYAQIISDLIEAEANLNEGYVAGNSMSISPDRVRPNKYAAKALLSRVYLYVYDYNNAEKKATEVIENSAYQIEPLSNVFLKISKEAIWQIMIPTSTAGTSATSEGSGFILTAKPTASSIRCSTISTQLLNTFETGDLRKTNWIKEFKDVTVTPNISYFYPFKFKRNDASATPTEYTTPFRLGEQYLIRAEARAQMNKLALAISDTDAIRKRAGINLINDINPTINKEDLLKVIQHERQVELFAEWGHRFFDLRRTETIDNVMSVVSTSKGGIWSSFKQLWPVPFYDIQNNPNLKQNPGYN
jgi:hypothetical protein